VIYGADCNKNNVTQELIQNAEDARASRITFLLDQTRYPARVDRLHHPALAQHQVCLIDFHSTFLPRPAGALTETAHQSSIIVKALFIVNGRT